VRILLVRVLKRPCAASMAHRSLPSLGARPGSAGSALWTSASAERLLRPLYRDPDIDEAGQAELQAKRLFASSHRDMLKLARWETLANLREDRQKKADAVRHERSVLTAQDVIMKIKGRRPAEEDKVISLSMKLNRAMCHLYPQSRSQVSYFSLFRAVDEDNSGRITLDEFSTMIRELLKIAEWQMGQSEVEAMWRWVDEDASGMISVGEFLRLMRKGWAGFLSEQEQLSKNSLLFKPNWNPNANARDSAWAKQTTTLQERRRFNVEATQKETLDRAQRLAAAASRLAEQRLEAEQRLRLKSKKDPGLQAKLESRSSNDLMLARSGRPQTAQSRKPSRQPRTRE
jgi:hypothetical protein